MKRVNLWKTLFLSVLAVTAFTGCSKDDSDGDGYPSITVDGKETAVGAVGFNGGDLTFTVSSSNNWTLTLDDASTSSWCSVATSGGRGNTSLTFSISKWEGAQDDDNRSVTATLVTYGSVSGVQIPQKASITVRQNKDASTVPATNVAEIRAKLKAIASSGSYIEVSSEVAAMTLTGIVVSDINGKNTASGDMATKMIAVQDSGSAEGSGLFVCASSKNSVIESLSATPGMVVEIPLTGAKINYYAGLLQLQIGDEVTKITTSKTEPLEPVTITVDKILDYEGMLVKIENCQPNVDMVGTTWDGSKDFEILPAKTSSFVVRTGSAAVFKDEKVPEKSGYVIGLGSRFNDDAQILPRTSSDLSGLTGSYSGQEYKTGTISQIALGEYWEITGSIVAVNTSSFLLADKTGYVLVYNSKWTSQTDNTYKVGQKVTVKGKIDQFPEKVGLLQFASPTITDEGTETFDPGQATVFDAAGLKAYESDMKYEYVTLSGILNIAQGETSDGDKYYSYTISVSGYSGKTVTLAYAFEKDFTGLQNGDVVDVKGFATGTNFSQSAINIMLTSIEKNTTTPAITITTAPTTFAADGGKQDIAFTVVNAGGNQVYAKVEGEGFSVPTGVVTSPVEVTAAANTGAAREATLTIYLASEEDGEAVVEASVTLKQSGASTGNGYTLIDKVADLTAGTYYMAGYSEEYKSGDNSVTFAPYSYHIWAGTVSGGDLVTVGYEFADGDLTINPSATGEAALITLEAVSGSANTYYIKVGDKYLKGTKASNRSMSLVDTSDGAEWTFDTHTKGGIKISNPYGSNTYILGTAGAMSNLLRSYKDPASTLTYGVCFFKAN